MSRMISAQSNATLPGGKRVTFSKNVVWTESTASGTTRQLPVSR